MNKITIFLLLATFTISACMQGNKNANQEEEHAHDDIKIQLTVYSDNFELFAEADPFVVGKQSSILAHFSHLNNFKALTLGKVTANLIIGTKGIRQTIEAPERPGIYRFNLQPVASGTGKIIFEIEDQNGKHNIVAENIIVYTDEHTAIHEAESRSIESANTTVFTKEQSWKIDFATELPQTESFGQVIKTTARVQSAQGDEVIVSANASGMVVLSTNNVLEGKSVSNGQVLFSISGSSLADNNSTVRFAEAQNNFEKARLDYERSKELAKDKIVSEKDLLNAKNLYDNTKVIFDNLNKNFSSAGQRISSPMSGFIKQIFVQNGQYVEAGQPVVSIFQNKSLLLRAEVQQKYAPMLGTIQSANIRTLHDSHTYTLEQLNGKIVSFGRNTNDDNYLIPVNLQINNKGGFVTGGFVEVFLKTLTNSRAMTVPNAALLEEQGTYFVYAQITPELFEKREVKIGATDGVKTEILKGIAENERIVSNGAIFIKLAQATGTLDAHSGHVH